MVDDVVHCTVERHSPPNAAMTMEPPVIIASRKDLDAAIEKKVEDGIRKALPEAIRQAIQPEYLTKAKLKELTGWSDRQIEYKKSKREIPFVKRGRLILFPTEEIYAYLEEGRVPARRDNRQD